MKYHNILHDDMRNGEGLRVVLFVSGCEHHCFNCQNPQTWDDNSGVEFDLAAKEEIFEQLSKDYISGITFSGGDPLYRINLHDMYELITEIKNEFPTKNIWIYTGFTWEDIVSDEYVIDTEEYTTMRQAIVSMTDVLVDGEYVEQFADVNYPWAGSSNQMVINVQESLAENKIVLYKGEN